MSSQLWTTKCSQGIYFTHELHANDVYDAVHHVLTTNTSVCSGYNCTTGKKAKTKQNLYSDSSSSPSGLLSYRGVHHSFNKYHIIFDIHGSLTV